VDVSGEKIAMLSVVTFLALVALGPC